MAFQAGGGGKVDTVTLAAGCILMVDTGHFTTAVGMCLVEGGRAPGRSVVALVALYSGEQTGMERWIRVAGGAIDRQVGEDTILMTLGTVQ